MIYDYLGNALDFAYDKNGNQIPFAYDKNGNQIWSSVDDYDYLDYEISEDFIILTGANHQGMAVHNGVICHLVSEDLLRLVDLNTGELIADRIPITSGHGNIAFFLDEYYEQGDEFPLFCASTGYESFSINRITRTETTLIKTISVPYDTGTISGYKLGYCYDKETKKIYTLGYTSSNTYKDSSSTNKVIVACWDFTQLTENQNGTFTPQLISTVQRNFIQCPQGCDYFNGYIWTSTGTNNGVANSLYAIEPLTGNIKYTYTLPVGEPEGLSWVDDDYLLFGRNQNGGGMYYAKLTFAEK